MFPPLGNVLKMSPLTHIYLLSTSQQDKISDEIFDYLHIKTSFKIWNLQKDLARLRKANQIVVENISDSFTKHLYLKHYVTALYKLAANIFCFELK